MRATTSGTLPDSRGRLLAGLLHRHGAMSRSELHERTGLHSNLVGNSIAELIRLGIVRESAPAASAPGRPRIPLEIDPRRRRVIGIGLAPGQVRIGEVDLLGRAVREEREFHTSPSRLVRRAAELLRRYHNPAAIAVGVAVPGFVDPARGLLRLSSISSRGSGESLGPLLHAAGRIPVLFHNDMHAVAQWWRLTHADDTEQVLLVGIDDGRIGASLLIGGQPVESCIVGGNELGHMRLGVSSARCFCGGVGCLERIVSSDELVRMGAAPGRCLADAIARPGRDARRIRTIVDHLATALVNAIHFLPPAKIVIVSPFAEHESFRNDLRDRVYRQLMQPLQGRTDLQFWAERCVQSAHIASWLALAAILG